MTREEAISSLKVWVERDKKILLQNDADRLENIEIYNMAIKALEHEPVYYPPCIDCHKKQDEIRCAYDKLKDQEPCDDCISRQAVLNMKYTVEVEDMWHMTQKIDVVSVSDIKALPPVTPQPETGHWIRVTDKTEHLVWECDRCSWQQRFTTNYCPDCGTKMESKEREG